MYYKNYIINSSKKSNVIIIAELDKDIKEIENKISNEWIVHHTIRVIRVPSYEIKHYDNYLDSNGLYLGILPIDVINDINKDGLETF